VYSIGVDNDKVVVGCSLWVDAGNSWPMAKLNAQAQGLQGNALEEGPIPILKYPKA
jgi:hypothetical protein